jgi:TRAP-type uncharacterized transport system substrate-binding protein
VIAADVYPGQRAVQTVSVRALWIVNDAEPDAIVHGVTRALFHPVNRDTLYGAHSSARAITLATATVDLPAPLHPGAARFYRESGVLTAPQKAR